MADSLNHDAEDRDVSACPAGVMPGAPLVEVERAFVTFPGMCALNDVSLVVRAGEHLAIRGGNGAGKSTLLRVLRGEQWLDQTRLAGGGVGSRGRMVWHTPTGAESSPLAGRNMSALVSAAVQEAIVRQGWNLSGEELVAGGFADTAFPGGRRDPEQEAIIRSTAVLLGAEDLLSRRVLALSQGQLRLLLAARALVRRVPLLLLDEVTEGLDAPACRRLLDALERVAEYATLVMTTHRPETLPAWIGRIARMAAGRLIPDETPPQEEAPPRETDAFSARGMTAEQTRISGGAGVTLSHVTVYIEGTPVLHDLDWEIRPGENWAVIGGNGAGKSTLLRLLAGDEFAALGGSIRHRFPGRDQDAAASAEPRRLEDLRRAVQLVSDLGQATYGYNVTGEELVVSGIDNTIGLYRESTGEERARAAALLKLVGASGLAAQRIRTCSSGELRRLLLARALAGEPDLLLLDEPFSGLDAESREGFRLLLDTLARRGVQMVLVTHHPEDVIPAITRTLHLENGRIAGVTGEHAPMHAG